MRFLLDANLPRSAVDAVAGFGHQVEFARDIGLASAPDAQIAERAQQSGAAIVTRDTDFADIRRYPPGSYASIIVLRLPDVAVADVIVSALRGFLLEQRFVDQLRGHLVIIEEGRARFRPALV